MKHKRTWIELNPLSFQHNVTLYKKIIGTRTLAIVIKANAYGHGMHEIAQLADTIPAIDMLCVATISDAVALRQQRIVKPILILSTIFDEDPTALVHHNIACSVYTLAMIHELNAIGKQHQYVFPIHLKIDTGLSRLGIATDMALTIIKEIMTLPYITLQGVYSHFTESHKQDQSFTLEQVEKFTVLIKELTTAGISIPFIHLANSAGTTAFDLPFCNLFRVGVGSYGFWPSQENQRITQMKHPDFTLQPIATWKTHIMSIKEVTKGSFIGYDRTFQAPHDMRIGVLPVGYYDGYDFRLFNKASVMIHKQYAPIIGRISMNVCTIDITSIPEAQLYDEVILMGPYPHIHPAELGLLAGNPNVREITTKINASIERIIVPPLIQQQLPDTVNKKKYTSDLAK